MVRQPIHGRQVCGNRASGKISVKKRIGLKGGKRVFCSDKVINCRYRVTELQSYRVTRGVTVVTLVTCNACNL